MFLKEHSTEELEEYKFVYSRVHNCVQLYVGVNCSCYALVGDCDVYCQDKSYLLHW